MSEATFRIGVVKYDQEPFVYFSRCFAPILRDKIRTNRIHVDHFNHCRSNPGYGVEVSVMLASLLGYGLSDIDFVVTGGWGKNKHGNASVDLVANNSIDLTVAQLAPSPVRMEAVNFVHPTRIEETACFLMCDSPDFLRVTKYALLYRLSGNRSLFVIFLFLVIFIGLWISLLTAERKPSQKKAAELLLRLALVEETPNPIGKFHSVFIATLISIVYLQGYFSAGMMETFTPRREFPFHDVAELAESIKAEEFHLVVPSPGAKQVEDIKSASSLHPIKDALSHNPLKFHVLKMKDPHTFFRSHICFDGYSMTAGFMDNEKATLDCMCDPLGTQEIQLYSIAINKQRKALEENVSRGVLRLREAGMLHRLATKYRIPNEAVLDSKRMIEKGLELKPVPVRVSLESLAGPFVSLVGAAFVSGTVFLLELRWNPNSRFCLR